MLAGNTDKRASRSGDIGSSVPVAEAPRAGDRNRASDDDDDENDEEENSHTRGDSPRHEESPGDEKEVAGTGAKSLSNTNAEQEATSLSKPNAEPERAGSDSSTKIRSPQSKRGRTGASDGLPPNGKLIVTPHVQTPQPMRGGRRIRGPTLKEPRGTAGGKKQADVDDRDGEITPKKSPYVKASQVKLMSVLSKPSMELIRRRFQFMMILRDGVEIDRAAPQRLLNLQLLETAAKSVLAEEDFATFYDAINASYADKQDM